MESKIVDVEKFGRGMFTYLCRQRLALTWARQKCLSILQLSGFGDKKDLLMQLYGYKKARNQPDSVNAS